jgi:ABC-2 type transport system ATP-binding protein
MLIGRLRGLAEAPLAAKVQELLQLLLLWDSRYATMAAYSKGMRQRVLLAAALLHNPDLLVLDEPFSGLDVAAGLLFRTLLQMFVARDRMVLFSTHRFDMVEQLCSRVVILSAGRIVVEEDTASFAGARSQSLEDVFIRATRQEDFAPLARKILDVVDEP